MPSIINDQSKRLNNHHNEIDLIDMVVQLWRARLTIIAFIIMALVLSSIYLVMAKPKWSSEAIVTMPDAGQTASYMNAMNVLYSQGPNNAPSVVEIQQRFFNRFNSLVSVFSEQLSNKDNPEKLTIEPAVKGQDMLIKITYLGSSPQNAHDTLDKYLQLINQRVITELNSDLRTSVNLQLTDLKVSLATQEKIAREKQQQRLDILSQALKVAEQSGIKKATVNQAETQSEDTLYLLGSEALSAMLKNDATRPLPLQDDYYDTRRAYLAISQLPDKANFEHAFRYVMKPNLPFRRDSPKRGLTLSLAVLLGGIVGSGYVLGRNALRDRQRRQTTP